MFIEEIDQISITILVDNSTDFLLVSSEHAVRPSFVRNEKFVLPPPVAEHGFSALITIPGPEEGSNNAFLFDTGVSENGVIHNVDIFGIDLSKIDGIILSHGHFDHFAGLVNIIKRISSSRQSSTNNIDVFIHPDAFLKRWEIFPDGTRAKSPVLDEHRLQKMGAKIHKNTGVNYLPSKESPLLVITGEIPRETSFEKGFPYQYIEDPSNEKNLIPDQLVKDDQAIVANILGQGIYEAAIEPTLKEYKEAQPDYLIPCHCTGWKAANRIIETMPEKFIQSSVGTTFQF